MGVRRFGLVALAGLTITALAHAQPADEDDAESAGDDVAAEEAAPATKDPKAAKKWLQTAHQLVRKGDGLARKKPADAKVQYANAVTAFEKAIEAGDDRGVYFDLASVEEKLGQLDRAATHYRVISKAETGVRADLRTKATAKFDELSMRVGLLTIVSQPEGATISIGDNELATSPMSEPIILMPGTYTLSLAAEGFQSKDVDVKIEEGSESERSVELVPLQMVVTPPADDRAPRPTKRVATAPSMLPIYVGGGVAVGAVAIGAITGILATSRHRTFTDPASSSSEREDARASGENFALVTDLALGTAVIAGGFTAYWYFVKYKPGQAKLARERTAAARPKIDVVPWVQSEVGGLTVAGSF